MRVFYDDELSTNQYSSHCITNSLFISNETKLLYNLYISLKKKVSESWLSRENGVVDLLKSTLSPVTEQTEDRLDDRSDVGRVLDALLLASLAGAAPSLVPPFLALSIFMWCWWWLIMLSTWRENILTRTTKF